MTMINLEGLKLEFSKEAITAGVIYNSGEHLRINIHDRDGTILTRVEIAVEDDAVVLKTWVPRRWEKNSPDHKFLLARL